MMAVVYATLGIAAFFALFRLFQHRKWGRCKSLRSMRGKTVIITGSNSGIGKETAKELASRGARVILACRNVQLAAKAAEQIRSFTSKGELVVRELDLSSFDSIHRFVSDFLSSEKRLDVLINNAGIFRCPFMTTKEGFEMQFGVNHLGHFLLTNLLLDRLKESAPSKVVVVASALYKNGKIDFDNLNGEKKYSKEDAYNNSKLANVLFTRHLAKKLHGTNVDVAALCPGLVWTNAGRHMDTPWWKLVLMSPLAAIFVKTPNQGCQTVVQCAVVEAVEGHSGSLFVDCKKAEYAPVALDDDLAEQLWEVSEQLVKLK